jgi:hypothetical protein
MTAKCDSIRLPIDGWKAQEETMPDHKPVSTVALITIPAVITLGVTILRLVGELEHWPKPWFSTSAGGGGAVVGISWLPIFFGPYFALKLAGVGKGPASNGKAIGWAVGSFLMLVAGGFLFGSTFKHPNLLTLLGLVLMLGSAFVPGIGWGALGKALVAYAFAARIPVLIVMYLAMAGNGRAGWGTHYDAVPPEFVSAGLAKKFIDLAVLPQMTLWIGWTAAVGSLLGTVAAVVAGKGKHSTPASAS